MRRGERNLIPTRPTSTPLEMTATEKAFVTLFDFVFTKIAFTYAPRTKIKQIRKCVSSISSDFPRQWYNPLPLSHDTVYVLSRTWLRACALSTCSFFASHKSDPNRKNPNYFHEIVYIFLFKMILQETIK